MKAQMVKNAVIVPVGAKGGFVVKRPPSRSRTPKRCGPRWPRCYRDVHRRPARRHRQHRRRRGRAPARRGPPRRRRPLPRRGGRQGHGHVLRPRQRGRRRATASGWATRSRREAATGYDHKEMGITARGAWESVRRHFRSLGVDADTDPLTVVGIGDMSGDVFGNGMLRQPAPAARRPPSTTATSSSTPTPTRRASFAERQRLFDLPRSSLGRLRPDRSSRPGGGVWPRVGQGRSPLSDEVRRVLGTDAATADAERAARRPS